MAVRRLHHVQPESFAFTPENAAWAAAQLTKYPPGRQASAVIPLLWRAQEQEGWVSEPSIRYVADFLEMPYIRVLEVATFYSMFHLAPVGRVAHVQVCGTTPCMLRGAGDIIDVCRHRIGHEPHAVTADGAFSWEEVECLGACVNAPIVQIFSDTYEDLDRASFNALLDGFAAGTPPRPGPQNGRRFSAPEGGETTLTDPTLYSAAPATAPSEAQAAREEAAQNTALAEKGERVLEAEAGVGKDVPRSEASRSDLAATAVDTASEAGEAAAAQGVGTGAAATVPQGARPQGLDAPRNGRPDDLRRIKGIGKSMEAKLHAAGLYHYDQIAALTPDEIRWLGQYLGFAAHIDRDDWRGQARLLGGAPGPET